LKYIIHKHNDKEWKPELIKFIENKIKLINDKLSTDIINDDRLAIHEYLTNKKTFSIKLINCLPVNEDESIKQEL
jgi:hypothetical protein